MDAITRLKALSEQMAFEPAEDLSPLGTISLCKTANEMDNLFVHPAVLPNGKKIKLLKTLLSSACERDCHYCAFRAGRDTRRATFQPEEFARLFIMLTQKGITEGIFLSSGVAGGGIRTQDKLLDTTDILRNKLEFQGYIHLKIMPGSEHAQVERAMQLADRVSVNLEAPNPDRLADLAPGKNFSEELLLPLKWMAEIRGSNPIHVAWKDHWPSSATQFVVGGAGESDLEIMSTSEYLYRRLGLRRVYYSSFNPIPGTPLENRSATLPIRELRLYQASFLLRDYEFDLEELPFEINGRLPETTDPKLAWAERNLGEHPIEINKADRHLLMRVPGIGPKSVEIILKVRRVAKIRNLSILKNMGVLAQRAAPYLLLDGRRDPFQSKLF